jgi:chemotaxis protein MotB
MTARSIRHRLSEATNIWPGFVDVLATLLIVIIFILMVFTVSQIYLSDAISGRDKALEDLRNQINELSKILVIESKEKQQALEKLSTTESKLQSEQELTLRLESEIAESKATISTQSINISVLSDQIENLLVELRIVAKALETYEGIEVTSLDTKGLGERINKALAARIDQLNLMNEKLSLSQQETAKQLQIVNELNAKLTLNEEELQNQVMQYQKLTEELIALNDSLDIKDQTLIEKIELIRNKNTKLALLNEELIKKDTTIFDLRGKILELNDILSISEETKIAQQAEIQSLSQKISVLETESAKSADQKTQIESLTSKIASLEKENQQLIESTDKEILEAQLKASSTLEQVAFLTNEIEVLKNEINILNSALEASEQDVLTKELKIEVLGERLNKALTSKVFELQKYRSEFFGRLQSILGDRQDIKVVGDRFIFESELLFDSGSASLQLEGKEKLKQIGLTLKETTMNIPDDIDWIIQVEGHTDKNPINTLQFPSNWELSTARANTVLKLLLELGFNPQHLSAAGYGEFYPISKGESAKDLQQNRRIELKLTSR